MVHTRLLSDGTALHNIFAGDSLYIFHDSKLLAPVVCFAELFETISWSFRADQYAPYTQFQPRPDMKELNVYIATE